MPGLRVTDLTPVSLEVLRRLHEAGENGLLYPEQGLRRTVFDLFLGWRLLERVPEVRPLRYRLNPAGLELAREAS